ncbi:MAG: OmpH family outer membrane protein [Kiritimatiellaeota bacterium]|nr:OmpH family outer membrane protein [Kiritimatiellota bacterium]
MKTILLSLLTALTASAQVVFVDMGNLVKRHPRTAEDEASLTRALQGADAEIKIKQEELKKQQADFEAAAKEAQNPALSAAAKKKAEDVAMKKRDDLLERDRQVQEHIALLSRQLDDQRDRYLDKTTGEIKQFIEIIAKRKGYKAVLPKQFAIYADPSLDITEEVAKAMDLPALAAEADAE